MMAILNLSLPILFLGYFLVYHKRLNQQVFQTVNFILIGLMFLFFLPIHFSNYEYSNWILRFLTETILFTGTSFLLAQLFIKFKKLVWTFFILAFLLNGAHQGIIFFGSAMGGGNYPSQYNPLSGNWNYDTLIVDTWVQQGFAGPPFRNYDVTRLKYGGLVYKHIAQSINPDTSKCVVNIKGYQATGDYQLNLCTHNLELPNGTILTEKTHSSRNYHP